VGFRFTNDKDEEGAVKLLFRKDTGASISAIAFLKNFKIPYGETRTYNLKHDKENNIYIIELSEPAS
jgi:hypothetical protein